MSMKGETYLQEVGELGVAVGYVSALGGQRAANTSPRLLSDLLMEQASLARCPSACDLANRSLHNSTSTVGVMRIKCT